MGEYLPLLQGNMFSIYFFNMHKLTRANYQEDRFNEFENFSFSN